MLDTHGNLYYGSANKSNPRERVMPFEYSLPALDRRALLRSAILLAGGTLAGLPGKALAELAADQKVRFFTPAQFATLEEMVDIIIPRTDTAGAKDAGVPSYFDALMLNWASKERRRDFRDIVEGVDKAARAAGGKPLPELAPAQRFEVVQAYDAEKMGKGDATYSRFKELVLTLYYLSEVGATQELRYEPIPGAWEPWNEIGPDTRAWAI